MLAALVLAAAAAPPGAVEAERAFAAMAQTEGQWTAFRAFAAPEAVMFVPEPVNAQSWLKGRADPAVPVMWWPARVIMSCDGDTAVTTGPWVREGGRLSGYFTTIWRRQRDGSWKWLLDHGDTLPSARSASDDVKAERPHCSRLPPGASQPLLAATGLQAENGESSDGSLAWSWQIRPDGSRTVTIGLWDGDDYRSALVDDVAAAQ